MIEIKLEPDFSQTIVNSLNQTFISSVDDQLLATDVILSVKNKNRFSTDLILITKKECKYVKANNSITKVKNSPESISFSDIDRIDAVFGTRFAYTPKMVAINLYSNQVLITSIRCETIQTQAENYLITKSQKEFLITIISLLEKENNKFLFDECFNSLSEDIAKCCELLSLEKEPEDKLSPSERINQIHLLERCFVCALLAEKKSDITHLVDRLDLFLIKIMRSALNFQFNMSVRGKSKFHSMDTDEYGDSFINGIWWLFTYRNTVFSFLPEPEEYFAKSSLHKKSHAFLAGFKEYRDDHKPESGLSGLLEKAIVQPALLLRTGKLYNFEDDIWEIYFLTLSRIIGLEEKNLIIPHIEGTEPTARAAEYLEVVNREIDRIISDREKGIRVDFDRIEEEAAELEKETAKRLNLVDKIPCIRCGSMILPTTAEDTGGLCMPCYR